MRLKKQGRGVKFIIVSKMGITILIFSPCCIVALLDISYSFLRIARDWNDIIGVVFKTSSPVFCHVKYRGGIEKEDHLLEEFNPLALRALPLSHLR